MHTCSHFPLCLHKINKYPLKAQAGYRCVIFVYTQPLESYSISTCNWFLVALSVIQAVINVKSGLGRISILESGNSSIFLCSVCCSMRFNGFYIYFKIYTLVPRSSSPVTACTLQLPSQHPPWHFTTSTNKYNPYGRKLIA